MAISVVASVYLEGYSDLSEYSTIYITLAIWSIPIRPIRGKGEICVPSANTQEVNPRNYFSSPTFRFGARQRPDARNLVQTSAAIIGQRR